MDGNQKKRKIAILGSRGYPSTYGGFETFVRRFAPYASAKGHEVTVYARGRPFGTRQVGDIRVIGVGGLETKSASTLSHGLSAVIDANRRDFDVVLVLNPANGIFLPLLNVPSVMNPDGLEWRRQKWGTIARGMFLLGAFTAAKCADEIVVDSAAIGRYWERAFHRQTTFIPYGTDLVRAAPTKRLASLGLKPSEYLLIVARLSPENNVELSLDALRRTDVELPLVVVGDANYASPTVKALEAAAANDSRVRWLGRIDDQELLAELWSNCLMYIHGHSVGGTNPALLQAMGHGAGPIALRTPFNREALGTEERLYADAQQLAHAIVRAVEYPGVQADWAARLAVRAKTRYSWERVCDAYLAVLDKVATESRDVSVSRRAAPTERRLRLFKRFFDPYSERNA